MSNVSATSGLKVTFAGNGGEEAHVVARVYSGFG